MVPCEIENRVFVSLAEAQALNLRIEDIPDIYKSVVASARQKITAWTKLGAVDFSLMAIELQVLSCNFLATHQIILLSSLIDKS